MKVSDLKHSWRKMEATVKYRAGWRRVEVVYKLHSTASDECITQSLSHSILYWCISHSILYWCKQNNNCLIVVHFSVHIQKGLEKLGIAELLQYWQDTNTLLYTTPQIIQTHLILLMKISHCCQ